MKESVEKQKRYRRGSAAFLNRLLAFFARLLLRMRYRIEVKGLKEIESGGRAGAVFLPNHPSLIDPVILLSILYPRFAPRPWAVQHQVDRPVIRRLARRFGALTFPAVGRDPDSARKAVERHIRTTAEGLKEGKNFLLYPSGHAYRSGREDLRGNTAAYRVLKQAPEARPVLVRVSGLWGSSLSWARGRAPRVGPVLRKAVRYVLLNFLFFGPRRHVTIEFVAPDSLPVDQGREAFNSALEEFYNRVESPALYVPYTIWERGGQRVMPEPQTGAADTRVPKSIPPEVEKSITAHLREISGIGEIDASQHLGRDLGIDSIGRAELLSWLEAEWGRSTGNAESVQTVGDLMLAAAGAAPPDEPAPLKEPPAAWFRGRSRERVRFDARPTVNETFLRAARAHPNLRIAADQVSGCLSYRRVLTGIFALRKHIGQLPGERVAIMLPASAGAGVLYLATLFAGKTPVMLNWTLGSRNMLHCLKTAGVCRVLTARALTDRLRQLGTDVSELSSCIVYLDDLRGSIGLRQKISAALRARFTPGRLLRNLPSPDDAAVILFTSGSESFPKAVPLTHENILVNLRDVTEMITIHRGDCLLGMLPPFHSFGLTVTLVFPLCAGVRTVYYPDPTDGATLAQLIDLYKVTLLIGTPTFLGGILRSKAPASLSSLRLAVTGAEKCPREIDEALQRRCPDAVVLEGYGITECSPVVSVNDENAPRQQTIGKLLHSFEHAIVDVDSWRRVGTGERGMLLLRGPCVFGGYLPQEGGAQKDPFVEFEGKHWYETGDLVREDEEGVLTFCGRLKRFVKIGGEMISLPAIEEVLGRQYPSDDGKPQIAVDAREVEGQQPRIVLCTTRSDIDRRTANIMIKEAGLSPLYSIKKVVQVDAIPLLGTGKTDYRSLREKCGEDY